MILQTRDEFHQTISLYLSWVQQIDQSTYLQNHTQVLIASYLLLDHH